MSHGDHGEGIDVSRPETATGPMPSPSGWTTDHWICEDCPEAGVDWGVPDNCPACGGGNVTTTNRRGPHHD